MAENEVPDARDSVRAELEGRLCDACGKPLVHKRRIYRKRFCNDRCRSDWHNAKRAKAEEDFKLALDAMQEAFAVIVSKKGRR